MANKLSKEDYNKIIKIIGAANRGKQIHQRYKGDRKFFKRKASHMTFDSFYRDIYKITEFKEKVPKLTETEYFFLLDALRWIKEHNFAMDIGHSDVNIDDLMKKLGNRNISEETGKYTDLLKVIRGMRDGKKYEYKDFNGWNEITLNMNIEPLNDIIKEGKIREIK